MTTAIEYALRHPAIALEWLIIVLAWAFAVVVVGWYLDNAWQSMRDRWKGWQFYPSRGWINAFGFFVGLLIVLLLLTRVTIFLLTMN